MTPAILKSGTPPPLQNGDRLTRDEFERRYEAMPGVKAELIEGVVYMASPVRHCQHSNPHFNLIFWLGSYVAATVGLEGGDNGSLKLDLNNEPQPDAYLIVQPKFGGRVRFDEQGFVLGAPEFVAEVSASSVSYDLHDKLEAYRKNGVQEYFVWRVLDDAFDWFALQGFRYERLLPNPDGRLQSRVLPGLWLDSQALIGGDLAKLVQTVQQGTATPEHRQFVEGLRRRATPTA